MARKEFHFDSLTLLLYLVILLMGWAVVYSVSSSGGETMPWELHEEHGKQLRWVGISLLAVFLITFIDHRWFETFSYPVYFLSIFLLLLTLIIGKEINGARSWIFIAGQPFQPSEFAKVATALALAKYMSQPNFTFSQSRHLLIAMGILLLPIVVVILQNDTGSALVFGSFIIVFYREGLHPFVPLVMLLAILVFTLSLGINPWVATGAVIFLGLLSFRFFFNKKQVLRLALIHLAGVILFIGMAFSVDWIVDQLPLHQKNRILVLFDPEIDPRGRGYNVIQSKIAIGSGGFTGKGYLEGHYTRYKFVPKQETDFIFCTVGEEFGWIGAAGVVVLMFILLVRVKYIAENSKSAFSRIYGYGVFSVLFFHVLVNIGMAIGLIPVIGIPLPWFSYGGSALLSFSVLLGVLINLHSHRVSLLGSKA